MNVMKEFHKKETPYRSLNSTFEILIPKKKEVVEIKDFRPISLIGSVHKIISKYLTRRLKAVTDIIIGPNQKAFVRGRQIMDCSLIANERINF